MEKGLEVISIDKNIKEEELHSQEKFKVDIELFVPENKRIGDILLINVLSCVDANKRIEILKNLKKIKSPSSRIFVINTSDSIGDEDFESKYISVKRKSEKIVNLTNKKIDGTEIVFDDYLIGKDEFLRYCEESGLRISDEKELYFPDENKAPIFNFYTLI